MNYAATTQNASAMLKKKGMAMALRVTTPGVYDPASGTESGAVTTDYPCVGILANPFVGQQASYFANSLVEADDKVATIGADIEVCPGVGNVLLISGVPWLIVARITVEPAGVPVLYKVQVRRG